MKIDDPIEVHLEQLKQDLDMGIETDLTGATVASILSFIPGAGAAIQSLLDGRAKENVQRRWIELFVELRKQIEAIRDSIRKTYGRKGEAVGCHRSQFPDGVEWATTAVRLGAEDAGRQAGVDYAEGFRRLRLVG